MPKVSPLARQPWYWAAWVLQLTAFGFAAFDRYVLAAIVFVASLASMIVAVRRASQPGGDDRRRATQDPRE